MPLVWKKAARCSANRQPYLSLAFKRIIGLRACKSLKILYGAFLKKESGATIEYDLIAARFSAAMITVVNGLACFRPSPPSSVKTPQARDVAH